MLIRGELLWSEFTGWKAGIPVIAYGRGCIREQVADSGVVVSVNEDFVATALPILNVWLKDRSCYKVAPRRLDNAI